MAKKSVASLQTGSKRLTKAIKMVKSPKTGTHYAELYHGDSSGSTKRKNSYAYTVSTAKDLDVIRAVFGDAEINYLGFSYGTLIGSTYAELFTERVGRMVLDGAINPLVVCDKGR